MQLTVRLHQENEYNRTVDNTGLRAKVDYIEAMYLVLFAVVVVAGWVSFTLAELGLDRPIPILVAALATLCGGLTAVARRPFRPSDRLSMLVILFLLAIAGALYFPPDEWILGGLDPGVYVSTGATIARTGGIVLRSTAAANLAPSTRQPLLFGNGFRLPGFYQLSDGVSPLLSGRLDVSPDLVTPHAFHFYPAILSFGYAVGGLNAELLVTPLLAAIGLVGFFLLARRLFGVKVAALGALLLSIGPAEVWYARYPAAEILIQVLLFGGLLAFVSAVDSSSKLLSGLSGLALGAVHLTKIEMITIPFLVATYFVGLGLTGRFRRHWYWFLVAYVGLLAQAILHAALIANFYAQSVLSQTIPRVPARAGIIFILMSIGVSIGFRFSPRSRNAVRAILQGRAWTTSFGVILPVLIAVLAGYAYYLRPLGSMPVPTSEMSTAQLAVMNNLQSFVRLGWYVSPLGLLFGTLGWMLLFSRESNRRTALLFLIVAADTFLFLQDMRIAPGHFWAARRWVPLVIPGFCLAISYVMVQLLNRFRQQWLEASIPVACTLVILASLGGGTRPLLGHVEYRGAIRQIGGLADTFPSNAVVLFVNSDVGIRVSVPFEYLFNRTSFVVTPDQADSIALKAAVHGWLSSGRPVFWVTQPGFPDPQSVGIDGAVAGSEVISLPEKLAAYDRRPGFVDGTFLQGVVIWKLRS